MRDNTFKYSDWILQCCTCLMDWSYQSSTCYKSVSSIKHTRFGLFMFSWSYFKRRVSIKGARKFIFFDILVIDCVDKLVKCRIVKECIRVCNNVTNVDFRAIGLPRMSAFVNEQKFGIKLTVVIGCWIQSRCQCQQCNKTCLRCEQNTFTLTNECLEIQVWTTIYFPCISDKTFCCSGTNIRDRIAISPFWLIKIVILEHRSLRLMYCAVVGTY